MTSKNMTTHNSRNAGRVYIMVSCAAPEGVYTQRLVLLLDMSTLQRAVLHLHNGRVYTTEAGAAP